MLNAGAIEGVSDPKEAVIRRHQQKPPVVGLLPTPRVAIDGLCDGMLGVVGLSAMDKCVQAQVQVCDICESKSPWAKREIAAAHVVEHLSSKPTVPPNCNESDGCKWSLKHCSFNGCNGAFITDDQLIAHLACKHDDLFMEAESIAENEAYNAMSTVVVQKGKEESTQMCQGHGGCGCKARRLANAKIDDLRDLKALQPQRGRAQSTEHTAQSTEGTEAKVVRDRNWLTLYSAAITSIEQSKVPVVGCSIDRRAVDVTNDRMHSDNLEAPICLFCARILAYDVQDDTCDIKKTHVIEQASNKARQHDSN